MKPIAAVVLYGSIWFVAFLALLPVRLKTQEEDGHTVPGTHSSAPVNPNVGRKALLATAITTVVWGVIAAVIISGVIRVQDLDFFNTMRPSLIQ